MNPVEGLADFPAGPGRGDFACGNNPLEGLPSFLPGLTFQTELAAGQLHGDIMEPLRQFHVAFFATQHPANFLIGQSMARHFLEVIPFEGVEILQIGDDHFLLVDGQKFRPVIIGIGPAGFFPQVDFEILFPPYEMYIQTPPFSSFSKMAKVSTPRV